MFTDMQAFRRKLAQSSPCFGVGITFTDPAVSEAIGPSVDFLWIDLEHNPISLESMQAHLMAARAARVPALVRVPSSDVPMIKRVLDSGAVGLIVPQVRSAAEVRQVVDACRYKPLGDRGYAPRRPSNYGRSGGAGFMQTSNQEVFVAVQIENGAALDDLEAIAAVPHLDALVIGPADLSISIGIAWASPELHAAMQRIVATAKRHGLSVGIGMGPDERFAQTAVELGVNWIQVGSDFSYMVSFADQLFARIRRGPAK